MQNLGCGQGAKQKTAGADDDTDIEFRANVGVLHSRGPQALYQMLDRLGAEYMLRTPIERLVRQFARGEIP